MRTPKTPSKRCPRGQFKNNPIIRQIVDRRHVGEPVEDVIVYAKTRLAKGAWDTMSTKDRQAFACEVEYQHRANQGLYTRVMRGR